MLALAERLWGGAGVTGHACSLDQPGAGLHRSREVNSAAAYVAPRGLPVAGGDIAVRSAVKRIGGVWLCRPVWQHRDARRLGGLPIIRGGTLSGIASGFPDRAFRQPGARDAVVRRVQAVRIAGVRVVHALGLILEGKIEAVEVEAPGAAGERWIDGAISVWQ